MGRVIYTVPLHKDDNGHLIKRNRSFRFGTDSQLDRVNKYVESDEYKEIRAQHLDLLKDLGYSIELAKMTGDVKNAKLLEKYVENLEKSDRLNRQVVSYAKSAQENLNEKGKVPLIIKAQMLLSCRSAQKVNGKLHSTKKKIHNIDRNLEEIVAIGAKYRKCIELKQRGAYPYNKSFSFGETDPIYEIRRKGVKRINEILNGEAKVESRGRKH